jgi:phage major head subunit gpT-like protein
MIITQATLDALRTEFSLLFKEAYEGTPVWYQELATEIPSSSRNNTYGWLAKQVRMRRWIGARAAINLGEHSYTIDNAPYEATIEIDKYDIEDDNLGVYKAQAMPMMAEAAKKHPDLLLAYAIFFKNPKTFDGKTLFAHDHPTFAKSVSDPQTYDNDYALELTPDNFSTIWAAMTSIRGEDGQPLMVLPNRLVVPPQLKLRAEQITKAGTLAQVIMNVAKNQNVGAAAVENMLKGWAEPLVIPELSLMPDTWYLACTTKAVKPFVRQLRSPYTFTPRFDPTDPKVFDQHVFTFGCEGRGAVGTTLPFLIARSNGAANALPTVPDDIV